MPMVNWTNVINNYVSRGPANANLYVATTYGATGNGTTDDTVAINSALAAAGTAGGGIVYLPPGNYRTTNTLNVPSGVELRGSYELRHGTFGGPDGREKGSSLQPYGGQGTTNGPPAVALAANSGLVGITINYQNQTYHTAFPPAIQGRGANVYMIGVQCAQAWSYVDLDTYTCTNHFLYMVDGWALNTWFHVGNGSSGTIADVHGNPTYWLVNPSGQSQINWQPATDFGSTNMQTFVLGNCTELFVKVFVDCQEIFMHCSSENNVGPNVTAISAMCDGSYNSYVFDATGSCTLTNVNSDWWCAYGQSDFPTWLNACAIISTTNFTGTARFLNVPLWGGSPSDYEISGGDIGLELVQLPQGANSVTINGGAFHLVNAGILNGSSSPFTVTYGPNSGMAGRTNELIGCYAYGGSSYFNASTNSGSANVWNDYALSKYSTLNPNLPAIFDNYPNSTGLFQYTNIFNVWVTSPAGIATSNIVVTVDGVVVTNLSFSGIPTSWNVSYPGLALNTAHTVSITAKDKNGNNVSSTVSFGTFAANDYTFEAEDFDYTNNGVSGLFIDNPQTNAYANRASTAGIDYYNGSLAQGSSSYRPQGLETEASGDGLRSAYAGGAQDYEVGYNYGGVGNWGNYTRTFPAGIYNVYMRAASISGPTTDSASLSLVTSGRGTSTQTTSKLGTFSAPNTGGWQTYTWVPLKDSGGNLVNFTGGSVETVRATVDNGGYNVNFYLLAPIAPVMLDTLINGQSIKLTFPTLTGLKYQVQYKDNITDANWTNLSGVISGNNTVQSVNDSAGASNRFYRVQIQ